MPATDTDAAPMSGDPEKDGGDVDLSPRSSDEDAQRRLRDVTVAFSRRISASLRLDHALQVLASDANRLFGASHTSIWLYDRRARELVLHGASDVGAGFSAVRLPAEGETPAARGLRLDRPSLTGSGHPHQTELVAPLRGWRRALGTLVVTGPFEAGLDAVQLEALAMELVRQLAPAIENIQLLEEVIHQRRLLEDTFNSIADPVIVIDAAQRVVQMNEAFAARVPTRREDVEQRLEGLVGEEMAAWAAARGTSETGARAGRTRVVEDARLGGTFAVTVTPLVNDTGTRAGDVLVARDITHETRLQREREALRERLMQSEKLAALGQFVAGIAHEMNNPLQGVLGHLELLIRGREASAALRRDLRRIHGEAQRAAKIVRNLLAFAGSGRSRRRKCSIPRVLSKAVASRARAMNQAGITIHRTEASDLPMVVGDPLLLHQAFLNVLINAEHAILSSGQSGRIEVHSCRDARGTSVITTVRDTGPGIPADVLPRIFDPFYTTKEVGKGTGLGLAITYGIVQEHGGSIHAANAAGGGAVFTLQLPAAGSAS